VSSSPEWTAISDMTPPSRWADLADRIALVEHGIEMLGEQLHHTLARVQNVPAVAEDNDLWWHIETLRTVADRIPEDLKQLNALLGDLFNEFGPKVKNSFGTRNVQWREGPWPELVPRTSFD
jgi:hypothetical protein